MLLIIYYSFLFIFQTGNSSRLNRRLHWPYQGIHNGTPAWSSYSFYWTTDMGDLVHPTGIQTCNPLVSSIATLYFTSRLTGLGKEESWASNWYIIVQKTSSIFIQLKTQTTTSSLNSRVGRIYGFADIYGRYPYQYWYISITELLTWLVGWFTLGSVA